MAPAAKAFEIDDLSDYEDHSAIERVTMLRVVFPPTVPERPGGNPRKVGKNSATGRPSCRGPSSIRYEYWEILSPPSVYLNREFPYIFVYCFSCRCLVELGLRQLGLPVLKKVEHGPNLPRKWGKIFRKGPDWGGEFAVLPHVSRMSAPAGSGPCNRKNNSRGK